MGQISKCIKVHHSSGCMTPPHLPRAVNLYLFLFAPVDCICMIFYICILSENRPKGTEEELAEGVSSRKSCTQLLKPFLSVSFASSGSLLK